MSQPFLNVQKWVLGAVIFGSWKYRLVDFRKQFGALKTIHWGILKSEVSSPKSYRSCWVIFLYNFFVLFQLCVLLKMEEEKVTKH